MAKSKARVLQANPFFDLSDTFEGWSGSLAVGVGFDGAVYAAARRSTEPPRRQNSAGAAFWKSHLDDPTDYLVVRIHDGQRRSLVVRGESILVSYVQPYPGGLLLAGARCRWAPDSPERNAVAVDWDGNELARLTLGDGIQDLRVTRDGTLWVSYFDEGVFGNYGWNHPGPRPIGEPGLVAFTPAGEVTFAYDAGVAGTDDVCDAYAMNAGGDGDVWLYFYTQFPIVRISGGRYRTWELGVAGARALTVRDDRVLLFGDYERHDLARLVSLSRTTSAAKVVEDVRIVASDGTPMDRSFAWGVGDKLFFLQDRRVLVVQDW